MAISILLDVPAAAAGVDLSTVHVFPVAAVNDESFLGRALDVYASRVRSRALPSNVPDGSSRDGIVPHAEIADATPRLSPPNALSQLTPADGAEPNPSVNPAPYLFNGIKAAPRIDDEFGLKRFQSTWTQDRLVRYGDVEHLCPRIPFLNDDDPAGGFEKPVIRLEDSVVTAFLETVGKASLQSVTWDVVNGVTSCARFFVDKVSLNKA